MSSIAAIDRRCFVASPEPAQPTVRAPQQDRATHEAPLLTWRPPLERARTRAQREGR